ncbi:MAG: hypothetical protein QXS76_04115, partial [Candidatus Bathyarchaeia archaeon]
MTHREKLKVYFVAYGGTRLPSRHVGGIEPFRYLAFPISLDHHKLVFAGGVEEFVVSGGLTHYLSSDPDRERCPWRCPGPAHHHFHPRHRDAVLVQNLAVEKTTVHGFLWRKQSFGYNLIAIPGWRWQSYIKFFLFPSIQ